MKIGSDNFPITHSFDILVNTAEWLIGKGKLKKENVPISTGGKRNLVNIDPIHTDGSEFRAPKILSNGLHVDTDYSTITAIKMARKLLNKCGSQENLLEITY